MHRLLVWPVLISLGGCGYAEGESHYLSTGGTRRYASLKVCEKEATARHPDGGPQYSGFECRAIRFGAITTVRKYQAGERYDHERADTSQAVVTLYRSSPLGGDSARGHVATFDARDGANYNRENCKIAAQLFRSQPGVAVRYWCEPGRFRRAG